MQTSCLVLSSLKEIIRSFAIWLVAPNIATVNFFGDDVKVPAFKKLVLKKFIKSIFEREGHRLENLNYIFCSDEKLLEINKTFLNHDYYTDVITFQTTDGMIHGDIFISTERVADNATQLKVPFLQELLRVMAHGALHLAGYRDKTPEDEAQMRAKEDQYLAEILPALK